jgi:WD40 repeat protein
LHRSYGYSNYDWGSALASKIDIEGSVGIAVKNLSEAAFEQPAILNFTGNPRQRAVLPAPTDGAESPSTGYHSMAPSGRFAAWRVEDDAEGSLVIWDIARGQEAYPRRKIHGRRINQILLLDDSGNLLLCPEEGSVQYLAPGNEPVPLPQISCRQAATSADGHVVFLVLESGHIVAWEITTGRQLWQLDLPTDVTIAARHERELFVTVAGDRNLRLWNSRTGQQKNSLALDFDVESASIAPDGSKIALGCSDQAIRLYSVPDLELLVRMEIRDAFDRDSVVLLNNDHLLINDGKMVSLNCSFSDWVSAAKGLFLAR